MITKEFTIKNETGLHARPAALLVKVAAKFKSKIIVSKDGFEVNGKSIMGVMTLAAEKGSHIVVTVDGKDEDRAVKAIAELIENKFNED